MDWLNALQGTLAVALVVTTGLLGLQQGTVRTLRGSNGDLRSSVGDLEREREILRTTIATERTDNTAQIAAIKSDSATQIAELKSAVEVLGKTVTGEAHLVALQDMLDHHHTESMTALNAIQQALMAGGGRS